MTSDLKIKLYNTLTRTKEDFVPLDPANVRMYVCGPTVYDFAHIGNARPAIVFDVLFRLLRHVYGESHTTYVRNITDVDDKINARAARDFPDLPLNEAIRRVTETTAAQYQKDTTALGCLPPTEQPRATDNIAGMQKLIGQLIANKHAYTAPSVGEVLFDVSSMPDYGKLSGRDLAENLAGARVEVDAHKRHPADFVLWKQSSATEPGWDSPWGRGRPGWHIECSAMSERYLGQVFDIHAGGLDLIFPHHENEIAQSRCAHGTPTMARYWLHNGFLQVEGQKMSKSLGNFFTIRELLATTKFGGRTWAGPVLRLAMLRTHYRSPIDWTLSKLTEAVRELEGFSQFTWDQNSLAKYEHDLASREIVPSDAVREALSDDLNTSLAISRIQERRKTLPHSYETMQTVLDDLSFLGLVDAADLACFSPGYLSDTSLSFQPGQADLVRDYRVALVNGETELAREAESALLEQGAKIVPKGKRGDLSLDDVREGPREDRVGQLIQSRLAALNAKDFKRADEIRAALLAEGIQLMDSKNDAGERVTKWEIKR